MKTPGYAEAIRETIRELAAAHPDLVLLHGSERTDDLALPGTGAAASLPAAGAESVLGAAVGLALSGSPVLVTLSAPAAARVALERLQADLSRSLPASAHDERSGPRRLPADLLSGPAPPGRGRSDGLARRLSDAPVVVRVPLDGAVPALGRFTGLHGLRVVAPATATDAAELLRRAFWQPAATLFLEDRRLYPRRERLLATSPAGTGAAVRRAGREVTLVAAGAMVLAALQAARLLASRGIEAEVIDLRVAAPPDLRTIAQSLLRTHRALVIDEGETLFGAALAAEITEATFDELDAPVGVVRVPIGTATLAEALACAVPAIVTRACWLMGRPAYIPTPQ